MAWVIQSISQGPVIINDINMVLSPNQIRDLDIIGRENAERSNDLKILINKGMIKEIKKDPHTASNMNPKILQEMQESTNKAIAVAAEAVATTNSLKEQLEEQKQQNQQVLDRTAQILAAIENFQQEKPVELKAIHAALKGINSERKDIANKMEDLHNSELSEEEILVQEKLLKMKDKKLESNYKEVAKPVIKNTDASVDDALDAMGELNI